mgnify:CR=1 FL=1
MDNHLKRPEIQDAILLGSGNAQRFSKTIQKDFLYYDLILLVLKKFINKSEHFFSLIPEYISILNFLFFEIVLYTF